MRAPVVRGRERRRCSNSPARKRTYTFAPFTSHTLQRVHRVRNERSRAFLAEVRKAWRSRSAWGLDGGPLGGIRPLREFGVKLVKLSGWFPKSVKRVELATDPF